MGIVEVSEIWAKPVADGHSFGDAGPYVARRLRVRHRVDPEHRANRAVVDLDLAPRDADGLVAFSHDLLAVEPVDGPGPDRPSRRLLIDVVNRGRPTAFRFLNQTEGTPPVPPEVPDVGDGHLLRRGWTVWCVGWQHDIDHPSLLGIEAPEVLVDGRPPRGPMDYTAQPAADTDRLRLALPGHRPAAPVPGGPASLWETGDDGLTFTEVEADDWWFDHDGRSARRRGGFRAGRRYRIRYTTEGSRVTGAGLLALRDTVHWARSELDPDTTILFGASQCGRVIRTMAADGLLTAEDGSVPVDGLLPVIAGARRGQFNQRFANPGILPADSEGLTPPFTYGELLGSIPSGQRPRVMALNTATEYWRGDAHLAHEPDPADGGDPGHVRVHHAAGTQHTRGVVPQEFTDVLLGTSGALGFSTVDYGPLLRGLLAQLVDWIEGRAEPTPSTVPEEAELTDRATVLRALAGHGWPVPTADSFGLPAGPVPAVDADGNEVGGIRLPDVAVPLGAHTGWNVRHPDCGAPTFQLLLKGATRWFPPEDVADRYRPSPDGGSTGGGSTHEAASARAYLEAVDRVVDRLVADRYVEAADGDLLRHHAALRWHQATGGGVELS